MNIVCSESFIPKLKTFDEFEINLGDALSNISKNAFTLKEDAQITYNIKFSKVIYRVGMLGSIKIYTDSTLE